jgi:uncharacterized membrane protein YqjE
VAAERDLIRPTEPSLADLASLAGKDFKDLVEAEVALAKVELRTSARAFGRIAALGAVIGVVAVVGLAMLLHGAAAALDLVWPTWAAYLTVGVATLTVAIVVGAAALRYARSAPLTPTRTLETTKETVAWLKNKIS